LLTAQPIPPRPVKKLRRLDNIDLRLLRVFVAVVEAHGFSEAQFALNLSASTLSTHLAALERKLGGRLCDRGRGGFRLRPTRRRGNFSRTSTRSTSASASSAASLSDASASASSTGS
jgi:DNA-binding transcriptional LysR family regulator